MRRGTWRAPLTLRLQVDSGSEVNVVGANWVPMLEIAGRERIEYRARWVSEAAFTANREMRLVIRITGTDNVRPVTFYVAQLHVVHHELELGWPELQKRDGCRDKKE